jgi:hypothetical protein
MPAHRKSLVRRLVAGKLAPAMEVLLWHFAYGKPKDTVNLNTTPEVRRTGDHLVTPRQVEEGQRRSHEGIDTLHRWLQSTLPSFPGWMVPIDPFFLGALAERAV